MQANNDLVGVQSKYGSAKQYNEIASSQNSQVKFEMIDDFNQKPNYQSYHQNNSRNDFSSTGKNIFHQSDDFDGVSPVLLTKQISTIQPNDYIPKNGGRN